MALTEENADKTLMIRGLRSKYQFLLLVFSTLHPLSILDKLSPYCTAAAGGRRSGLTRPAGACDPKETS